MSRRVELGTRYFGLILGVVICWLAVPMSGRAVAQGVSPEEQQLRLQQARDEFVRNVGRIPSGGGDRRRTENFREDLLTFREELVALWALRFAPMDEEWARDDLGERSEDLGDTLEDMRKFVNRDSDPPDFEPEVLLGDTLAERLDRMVFVGLRLRNSVIEVTEGEVLDLRLLNRVRADFATLESWTEELRELARN